MNAKQRAAEAALEHVKDGMLVGLGTGSTADYFIQALAGALKAGRLHGVRGIPTSTQSERRARQLGVPLAVMDGASQPDVTIDGADEVAPNLDLIKGLGGALLREKIVAAASARMIVIADDSKLVERLGRFPLPIEVVPFGLAATRAAVRKAIREAGSDGELRLRTAATGQPFLTDGGHCILDAALGRIDAPERLAAALAATPGVVEHGLFLGLASGAILATESGLVELGRV
jgi:ribose 5-phosphate isomerase A